MPSPFPGMNPYLEQIEVWHDFHERVCPLVAELLTAQVRPHYIVKIDEHIYIHELPAGSRTLAGRSDIEVARLHGNGGFRAATSVLEAPAHVRLPAIDIERVSFVEVRDRASRQLITVIEFLSPSNKMSGPYREQYIAKRSQVLASPVHFVEVDLLRGGPRMPFEKLRKCDYYAMVSRAEERPRADIWQLRLRQPLPTIPIPLQAAHADAELDLQRVLHRIYDAAGYEDYIYQEQPQPALSAADAIWARKFKPKADGHR
jgi:hypothetical protein